MSFLPQGMLTFLFCRFSRNLCERICSDLATTLSNSHFIITFKKILQVKNFYFTSEIVFFKIVKIKNIFLTI